MNVGRIRHLLSDAMLAHLIRPTNRIESVGQIRHFRSIRHLLSDAMLAPYPTYKSHRTVGRIRRLRRIRQIVNCSYFFASATTLTTHAAVIVFPHAVVVSVIQIALYFVVIIYAAGITANGRLEITASAHGLAVLKPSLMALSRITT